MPLDKQYLYPSGNSFGGKIFIAAIVLVVFFFLVVRTPVSSCLVDGTYLIPLVIAALMAVEAATGACMLVKTQNYRYAYQVDKALCISLADTSLKEATMRAMRLYGPVFEQNGWEKFSSTPTSPWPRNVYFGMMAIMIVLASLAPIYHLALAWQTLVFPAPLLWAWGLLSFDVFLWFNRLRCRAGIRKFWAYMPGGRLVRKVLQMELAEGSGQCPVVPNNDEGFVLGPPSRRIRISRKAMRRQFWLRLIFSILLITIATNLKRCKRGKRASPPSFEQEYNQQLSVYSYTLSPAGQGMPRAITYEHAFSRTSWLSSPTSGAATSSQPSPTPTPPSPAAPPASTTD